MPAKQKKWREAIDIVLSNSDEPMHYGEITEEIIRRGLRTSLGATPSDTVHKSISDSIHKDGGESPYVKVAPGIFARRKIMEKPSVRETLPETDLEQAGLIQAFGMYWERQKIDWGKTDPKLYGIQMEGAEKVNFSSQLGVYILYDRHKPIYVGQTKKALGERLRIHTRDRHKGRWDRFSWFGILAVDEQGKLQEKELSNDKEVVLAALEALLIEAMEPSQNRRKGDDFQAEFLQEEDPAVRKQQEQRMFDQMRERLR